ncbi:HTH-type transcriptional repressor ComR [Roseivivax sp. THAF40]|uniref:TetR/AcrR family transcriptional regulator n=1 Tax=unclassified Roseivivax TaxID=2639302 RepID=UPI00126956BF|nr:MULTISPECIES: TetR/AcrR family transcriptional regulator [unclassified Roseivivax]QFS81708.1 HTH-type transcriptional repressor ComR [Roseivivax sp. THAF197b]QFT45508.1 HTH-type transcriptional repressor ComR [Roseivivax sp. THAF40]
MGRSATYDKDKVLKAAMDLFWARGYHTTSLKDLERVLDMRPGSIYAAFGSKEALFRAALDRYSTAGLTALEEALAQSGSPIAGLAAHVRMFGGIARDALPSRACMLVKTLLETPDDEPELRRSVEDMMRQTERAFAAAFRSARDAGEIAPDADPDQLAARLQAAIFGLRAYAQRTDADDRVARIAEEIAKDVEALRI